MVVDAPQLILGGIFCTTVVSKSCFARAAHAAHAKQSSLQHTFKLRRYPICRVIFASELITSTPIFEDVNQKILVRTLRRQVVVELEGTAFSHSDESARSNL